MALHPLAVGGDLDLHLRSLHRGCRAAYAVEGAMIARRDPGESVLRLFCELSAAAEPTRELSDRVLLVCGWQRDGEQWTPPVDTSGKSGLPIDAKDRPHPAAKLGEASDLVPKDWHWSVGYDGTASFGYVRAEVPERVEVRAPGLLPACVLCAAYVRVSTFLKIYDLPDSISRGQRTAAPRWRCPPGPPAGFF